jgi:hypothetical protein
MSFFDSVLKKLKRVNNRIDGYQTAVTFAEAGMHEQANQLLAKECSENPGRHLVVASHDNRFSEEAIEYSLDMAKRIEYGIIAVNAANLTHRAIDIFPSAKNTICEDFRTSAIANAKAFSARAAEEGLQFTHVVKFVEIDDAIEEIRKECGEIEFIISENQETQRAPQRIENENKIARRLCVYSMT